MSKKVILSVLVLSMLLCGSAFAQKLTYIKIGSFNPKATDGGLIISLGTSKEYDDKVELGVTLDFFTKERVDEIDSTYYDPDAGWDVTQKVTIFDSDIIMIPLMANLTARFPIEFPIIPYVSGSIGYIMLWNKFNDYLEDDSGTKYYGGLGWRIAGGGMYPLGAQSAIVAEIFYNGGTPSRSEDSAGNLPIRTEVDMSGLGFSFGIRLGGFGFF